MVTTEKKLRRQTMMPRQAAAPVASPTLSQRRTRRQSMMPVKLRTSPPGTKVKVSKAKPSALPTVKSKRKLTEEILTLEESPVSKRRRVVPISKSSTQVKTAASPTPSKQHKSMSALPAPRSTRKAQSKTASPRTPPLESSRRKTPARKRALSPAKATPSPPKRRATSRSKSESQFVRGKSLTRSQKKKTTAPKSKSSVHIKSPITKKLDPSPKKKSDKKQSAASLKRSPKSPASPARKKATSATTPKKTGKTGLKKMASSSTATPPAPPPPKSAKKSQKKASKTALKETVQSPSKTPASKKKTPTPKTPTAKSPPSKKKTPAKTPDAKSPASKKKTPSTSAKTPPTKKTPTTKTPKKTPTAKSPPSQKKSQKKTPTVVAKKVKSPPISTKKRSLSSAKVASPKSPSPQKRRLVRSTAKSHMSDIKTKSLRVVLHGISPPSSLASFRKTPSSKRAPDATPPKDLGESPDLPSARKQLKRIRDNIAFAHERRHSASATPRKSLSRTANKSAAKPTLGKVVTQADIHATATDKCDSDGTLANHCDSSSVQDSTPSARPPLPATPKSSRGTNVRVCHFSSRIASSASVQRLTRGSAPHSSTPIKGSAEDSTILSESMDDSVDGRRADTSSEGMNGVEEDTSMEESVETQEAESTTPSRKSYCSLM